MAPWTNENSRASSRGKRGELKCKPRVYEEKKTALKDKLKNAYKRASKKTASLQEDV